MINKKIYWLINILLISFIITLIILLNNHFQKTRIKILSLEKQIYVLSHKVETLSSEIVNSEQKKKTKIKYSAKITSFKNKDNARKLIEQLKEWNIKSYIISDTHNNEVIAGDYFSKDEIISAIKKLENKGYGISHIKEKPVK